MDRHFQIMADASLSAMIMVGEDGRIALVNSRAEKLFGYRREELLGYPLEMLVPERFRANHVGYRTGFFGESVARTMGEGGDLFCLRRNGAELPIEIGLSPILTEDGKFVLASIVDITWRRHVEAELQARSAEMERFTYTVSHDLKSPLITIKSYVAMIGQNLAAGKSDLARPDLERVSKAADKMHRLLDELLRLSRAGHSKSTLQEVNFAELANEALELVAGRINERNIRVEMASRFPDVIVDRSRLIEVLQNLIDNAAKFTVDCADPLIQIGAHITEGETRFFVKDNGRGIDPKYHHRIFGLFDKLDAKSEGSGAGLAIVKKIIEVHGGRIWVESTGKGDGSIFWFTLSALQPPGADAETEGEGFPWPGRTGGGTT
jgi:PAS domain S-box-containing protein